MGLEFRKEDNGGDLNLEVNMNSIEVRVSLVRIRVKIERRGFRIKYWNFLYLEIKEEKNLI